MSKSFFFSFFFTLFIFQLSFCQSENDLRLASYYFTNGEFDKAVIYYKKIYQQEPTKINFHKYYECLLNIKDFKVAEKLLKQNQKKYGDEVDFKFLVADFYALAGNETKSKKEYDNIIASLPPFEFMIIETFESFLNLNQFDRAFETLKKGKKILKNNYKFELEEAIYYEKIGDTDKMLDTYFKYIQSNTYNLSVVQTKLSKSYDLTDCNNEIYQNLKSRLLTLIQKHPEDISWNEMLIWLYLTGQNYKAALRQVIAIENRSKNSDGQKIFYLGLDCIEAKAYDVAIQAFQELISTGEKKSFFIAANYQYLNASFKKITENKQFNSTDLKELIVKYDSVIDMYTNSKTTLNLMLQKIEILAYYLNQIEDAVDLLNTLVYNSNISLNDKAVCKMKLADIYVLKGDIWEASLLYMQIDKAFKYSEIGQEAKLKNAKIYYFDGEYEYAQSQLDVLKQSTSKLIANDAMELSILITDNLGLDSNFRAMNLFSKSELEFAKHNYLLANNLLDSITINFPYHGLIDEVWYKKGLIDEAQGNWLEAIDKWSQIANHFSNDILADDALYKIASTYQFKLNNQEKAKEYYKKILFEYQGSLYLEEAREQFRFLRGDKTIEK